MKLPESPASNSANAAPPPSAPKPANAATTQAPPAPNAGTSPVSQAAALPKLQVGQLLNIQVVKIEGKQLTFTLPQQGGSEASKLYRAETLNPLKPGAQYQVKVTQTSPVVQLQLQAPATQSSTTPANTLLRQLLPNMLPLNQALQQLTQPALLNQLPPSLQQAIHKLSEALLKPTDRLDGKTVKKHFENSGLFLENKIAKNSATISQDLKTNLLKLQQQIQQTSKHSPELEKVEKIIGKMLDRTTVQQIESAERGYPVGDLPIEAHPFIKALTLQFRTPNTSTDANYWQAVLDLQTEEGDWWTSLHLNSSNQLTLKMWIENPSLKQKVQQHLDELIDNLSDAGLSVLGVRFEESKPMEESSENLKNLINIQV